jgi:hypothetical protein
MKATTIQRSTDHHQESEAETTTRKEGKERTRKKLLL